MTVTFLVAVTLSDTTDLLGIAEDITDALDGTMDVVSVKPWARPADPFNQPSGGFASLNAPPPSSFGIPPNA